MPGLRAGRWRGVLALAALALAPGLAQACSAENCPFQREALGTQARRATVALRFEQSTQDQLWDGGAEANRDQLIRDRFFSSTGRHDALELYTRTSAWILDGRARVNDRFELTASLPYLKREHRHMLVHAPAYNPAFEDEWKYEGLGDAVAMGHYLAHGASGRTSLIVQGGVKLPTGMRHVPDQEKVNLGLPSMLEPSVRPGTGSTDWLVGLLAAQPLPWSGLLPLTAQVMFRWNGTGAEGYRLGDQFQAGAGAGYVPFGWLTLVLQANYVGNTTDTSGEPVAGAHGMSTHPAQNVVYLSPGATVRVAPQLALYALYQTRVWGRTDDANVVSRDQLLIGTAFTPRF
jgi:hypothetical protein